LGTIFSTFYRSNITLTGGLTEAQAADARESIAGAISVARDLPPALGEPLAASARMAFDSGIAPTSLIAAALTLTAAVVVVMSFRGSRQR
jgi:DHA2 family multidrug resistance protein-like MFS transporter